MRVLVVPNIANTAAVNAARELAAWLTRSGAVPLLVTDDAVACDLGAHGVERSDVGAPSLVVALGGDGTILKAVHLLGTMEVPVLGVNLGRLGFLAGARAEMLMESVEAALAGEGRIERRGTLEATVRVDGREAGTYRALNEVFLGRGSDLRVIDVGIAVNGSQMARVRCDGVVVATSTGSTAYALSAGGPIVSPEVACAVVVPVAPHTVRSRPLVVSASDHVELVLYDTATREARVAIDGVLMPCDSDIGAVSIVRGAHDVLIVKLDGRDFFGVVAAEFLGGP
ncbi:MAG: NAD(+)/NADH kinase [Clostridiales bacterium]|nr:NAD(+)/NADH kinase [Clostridiales bacterium]